MMKKTFCSIIAVISVLALLASCGKKDDTDAEPSTSDVFASGSDVTGMGDISDGDMTKEDKSDLPGRTDFSEEAQNELVGIRQTILDSGSLCGIRFLGGVDRSGGSVRADRTYLNRLLGQCEWSFLSEIGSDRVIESDFGQELYVIIPLDDSCGVSVFEWECNEENGFVGESGKELFSSDTGLPVLLICNSSDIIPDMHVSVTGKDGSSAGFEPRLSLMDGSITLPFNVPLVDLTPVGPDYMVEEYEKTLYSAQFEIIEQSIDMWAVPEHEYESKPVYTVADLDNNGRVELISSYSHGTGMYSTSKIYEINESFTALEECRYGPSTMSSEPDIATMSWGYYMNSDGEKRYIVTDFVREGAAQNHTYKYALTYENGFAEVQLLAYVDMYAEENNIDYRYYDADGNRISALSYDSVKPKGFGQYEENFIQLVWFELDDSEDLSYKLMNAIAIYNSSLVVG